jgi:excisionase family DNA binding protein
MSWVTVKQVAEHLQLSDATVYAMARAGELPATKIGSQWRFDLDEVDAWVRRQAPNPASPSTAQPPPEGGQR